MIKIAVCDDENTVCAEIKSFILKYAEEESLSLSADTFNSGAELIERLKAGEEYALIFLDIEINEEKGSDLGNFIRNELKNRTLEIVYISYYKDYAMSLFESRPLDFIIKPVTYEKISRIMEKFIDLAGSDNKIFNVIDGKLIQRVLMKDIIYFERSGFNTSVVMTEGKLLSRSRFDSIKPQLPFVRVHKSFIVNLKYVSEYKYSEMIMTNGDFVPVSRSYRPEIRKIYINEILL
ncbi:MAG: LytTR family DNA-binding domain-containing protein [Clostridiales bacterium]|nr:LytTR family DNA-binding domain-containing protein [Clostridiales bacterium]